MRDYCPSTQIGCQRIRTTVLTDHRWVIESQHIHWTRPIPASLPFSLLVGLPLLSPLMAPKDPLQFPTRRRTDKSLAKMVATAPLLFVAFALLASDVFAASSLSVLSQRSVRTSTTGGFGSNDDFISMTDYEVSATYKSCEDRAPSGLAIMQACIGEDFVDDCAAGNISTGESTYAYSTVTSCVADFDTVVDQLYGNETYLRLDVFSDAECTSWVATHALLVAGGCLEKLGSDQSEGDTSFLPVLYANGSASWASYHDYDDHCSGVYGTIEAFWIDAEDLSSNACIDKMKWYTNAAASNTTEGSAGSTGSAELSGSSNATPHSVGVKASGLVIASVAILAAASAVLI